MDRMLWVASRMDFGKNSSTALKNKDNFKYSNERQKANNRHDTEIIAYFLNEIKVGVNILPNISWESVQNSSQRVHIKETHRRGNDALEHRIVNVLRATHAHRIETNWSENEKKFVKTFSKTPMESRTKVYIIAEIPWNANYENGNDQRRLDGNAHFCAQCKRRIFIQCYWFIILILCVILLEKYSSFFLFCPENKAQKLFWVISFNRNKRT